MNLITYSIQPQLAGPNFSNMILYHHPVPYLLRPRPFQVRGGKKEKKQERRAIPVGIDRMVFRKILLTYYFYLVG